MLSATLAGVKQTILVSPDHDGKMLGDVLKQQMLLSTRQRIRIKQHGSTTRNGVLIRFIDRVYAGDRIDIDDGQTISALNVPASLPILYEDDRFVAINKPAGIVTHKTVHAHVPSVQEQISGARHMVGRLDKDTSGVLLIAKDPHAHHFAAQHIVSKQYLGIVHGRLPEKRLTLDSAIRRSNQQYLRRVCRPDGKAALTRFLELQYNEKLNASLIAFRLDTGRTHQIRVHALWNGTPLLGDWLYGIGMLEDIYPGKGFVAPERALDASRLFNEKALALDETMPRQALHASSLRFLHPDTRKLLRIEAPLPGDFLPFL